MRSALIELIMIGFFIMNITQVSNANGKNNLMLLPVKDDPTISIRIMFKVGSQNDPAGKEGLAYLTAQMLSEGGTINNSYEKILEKLYPLAASYTDIPSVETTTFTGRVHKDNLDNYYPLFIDAVLHPAFNEGDFKRIKDNTLNYLSTTLKYSSDEELGKAVLYNNIFKNTPYGHIAPGTISGIKNISLEDVKDFYKKYYNKNNYVLGVGGGFTEQLVDKIQEDLNKLPDETIEKTHEPKPSSIKGLNITIVNKDAASTAISMGFPIDVLRGQKEWYALAVANSWFGEHRNSSSHLYQVIREKRGLNYGDYSYIENFPNGGRLQMPPVNYPREQQIFEIWIRPVPNETRHFVLRAAIRELHHLADNGLTEDQFELTRNFLSKYILHYAPSTSQRLGYALDDRYYGINGSHLEMFQKMLKQISLDDVNNAIKKYLQYKNMTIAVITNDGEQFKKDLINNTDSPIVYTSPKSADILAEDKEIMEYILPVEEDNVKLISVEDLFK